VTLNINGIQAETRLTILHEFCNHYDIDILLLQEVTHQNFDTILHRNKYLNVGTEGRGTAIFTKEHIHLTDMKYLPSGRGMAGRYHDMYIINLYAPSGTSKKKEIDKFYISDLPYLLQHKSHDYIIGGDFNCVLRQTDCIGPPTNKRLEQFIKSCRLIDAWDSTKNQTGYTHYTSHGASRIDRIYDEHRT
jgi:exonuclease III